MTPSECVADFNQAITLLLNASLVAMALVGLFAFFLGYLAGKNVAFKNWIESPLPCDTCRQEADK